MACLGTSSGYRDLLDTISTALIWSLVEVSVAIVASCLPSIRPLIHRSSASINFSKPTSGQPTSKLSRLELAGHSSLGVADHLDDFQRLANSH